jgi:8-oxo-dGTP diphosphatase
VGVTVFLVAPDDTILIARRLQTHGHGTWGLIGGHVEFREDPVDTIIRETQEETGAMIKAPMLWGYSNDYYPESDRHYLTLFFAVRVPDKSVVSIKEPDKVDEQRWVTAAAMPSNLMLSLGNFLVKIGGANGLDAMIKRLG